MDPRSKIKYAGNTTKPGNPIWDEYIDATGRSSLEVHTPIKIWEACKKNHYFVITDQSGNVQCKHCGFGQKIVWGIHVLKNGKIVTLKVK